MRESFRTGLSFGLTSGIITTLGLMVGLNSGTHSRIAVLGGILTIAIADALSDSLGIHTSEEAENHHTHHEVWESTFSTFVAKFLFALTFAVPILLFSLSTAVIVSIAWGLSMLILLNYRIAKLQKITPWKVILEHLTIAVAVIITTYFVGILLSYLS
ncbi:MAG: hypothetical protein COY66_02910 [Candidatus Kerfeldbacteria bacterium CG_4_10_14_0_8_um_filter_42_10]|uniref:VIT family protein n=1 Tax=Candidatus Kerfeldbacteria bacterium CG_4_10_14_0_8_um_filter_42_10 TaxID=2014248 RepID=A0A2M7RJ29_9BACT|nr:MAG: hypothetical protein COY66_02910 [Candidatus Kerfeldbacteria bacterium CG_4_10_14_0_8_um_filter_42_10]